jgi:DNA transposition AAA+ family ATPase
MNFKKQLAMSLIKFTNEQKQAIAQLVLGQVGLDKTYQTNAQLARAIGLKDADMSNLKSDKWTQNDQLIGFQKWLLMARFVGYNPNEAAWHTANTMLFEFVSNQLAYCQAVGTTAILCDEAGIGKTHAAREYCKKYANAYYIDCSVNTGKAALIRALAKAVGVEQVGRLSEVLENLIYMLSLAQSPLIVFDEAGDLDHAAVLVLKRLYNALEDRCGMYLIGADGLKRSVERGIAHQKLGYVEVFSRFGKRFQKALADESRNALNVHDKIKVLKQMALDIAKANGIVDTDELLKIQQCIAQEGMINDLRRVKKEILKIKNT